MPAKSKTTAVSNGSANVRVSDLMHVNPRFRKSVQIELDFHDRNSTSGYVATEFVVQTFNWILPAFARGSTQRAWRLTGDYGSGKSAFVLALAKAACGKQSEIPVALRGKISTGLHPVFVTGDREPLHESIGKAVINQVPGYSKRQVPSNTPQMIALLEKAHKDSDRGIFLVLDELGKNLEYAMMEPASTDVYVLQRLAEMSSRSNDKPFVVIAILHMGIGAYTNDLDSTTRREWDKVAGRFDELLFQHPFEQTVQLCAEAIGLETDRLPPRFIEEASRTMEWAVEDGLYGSAPAQTLREVAPRIFPLHPVALPPLMNLLRRFCQNERSLFSFLSGHESAALQEVAGLEIEKARFFRLADLYNYVRQNIAHTMTNGRATHWRIIESVVRKVEDPEEVNCLKSIGILNLLDDDDMLATRQMLIRAMGAKTPGEQTFLSRLIDRLKEKKLLFERSAVRGFALWPHSSVHLDDAFADAKKEIGAHTEPMRLVASKLEGRQIVARRHYIETGNLRHFELQFLPAKDYERFCGAGPKASYGNADGFVVIFLPENEREHRQMLNTLKSGAVYPSDSVLVGLSRPPLDLLGISKDLQAWQFLQTNLKELSSDEFARRELRGQIRIAKERLDHQIDQLLGWNHNPRLVSWFRKGHPDELEPDGLSSKLSQICEEIYKRCPKITNELINRRVTSSAASRARTALIDAIAMKPGAEYLGMDDSKNPPEMAIYLSVLRAGNLHIKGEDGIWKFVFPSKADDHCRLLPAFETIEKILKQHDAQRVKVSAIIDALRDAPIGARDGLIPLILALYIAGRRSQTAIFEDSTYTPNLDGDTAQRLTKEPEAFQLQHCAIEGDRMDTFDAIAKVFNVERSSDPEVLDVVRPLMEFVARLPEYSRSTKNLSKEAIRVRTILLAARDPVQLIFRDLPEALQGEGDKVPLGTKVAHLVGELSSSYDALLSRLSASITEAFGTKTKIGDFRKELSARSKATAKHVVESDLKSFVLRIGDDGLDLRQWLESMANHLSKKSAVRWGDPDEEVFNQRLIAFTQRMLRTEAAQGDVTRTKMEGAGDRLVRVILTQPDGHEHGQLFYWSEAEEAKVSEIEQQITALIHKHGRAGLGATAKALWAHLRDQ